MSETMTCDRLVEEWLSYKAMFVDEITIKWYREGLLSSLKTTGLAVRAATDIRKTEVYCFIRELKNRNAAETLKRKLESLEACWKWGVENGFTQANPWTGLSTQIKVPQKLPPEPFTTEEIRKILSAFESSRYSQLAPFVRFLFLTGVRTGEAIGLRWQDINPELTQLTISSQYTRRQLKPAKCKKIRTFGLSQEVQELLKQLKHGHPPESEFIFGWNGKRIDLNRFRSRVWKPLLDRAMVRYRTVYVARSTFISHCLDRGMNPTIIAAISGHDPAVLFRHYAGRLYQPSTPNFNW